MNCPVCSNAEISQDKDRCPACESDLKPYHHISKVKNQRNTLRTLSILFGVLLLASVGGMLFMPSSVDQTSVEMASIASSAEGGAHAATEQSKLLDEMRMAISEKDAEIASLKSDLASATPSDGKNTAAVATVETHSSEENVHIVKAGESLWDIAETYLGDNRYFGKIAWDNHLENMSHIEAGDTLIIKH